MEWEQRVIDEVYGGDKRRFEKSQADFVQEPFTQVVHWKDLECSATVLPDLESSVKELIKERLGYIPHCSVTLPFEAILRILIQKYTFGFLCESEYLNQIDEQIKLIRNEDMKQNTCLVYDAGLYHKYQNEFQPYGNAARLRIGYILGYEPKLECSLVAELWLRDTIAKEELIHFQQIKELDVKAFTLIKYREFLLADGVLAANQSPLWGKAT